MIRPLYLLVPAFCLLLLAACHDSDSHHHRQARHYQPGDGAIDLQGDMVVIRAGGTRADAQVSTDGDLRIGGQPVEINAEGRAALKQYDVAAIAIEQHAEALGEVGLEFGLNTVREVLHGLFKGSTDEAGKHAEEGVEALAESAQQLCGRLDRMFTAQQAAAAAIPEFKPYAVISQRQLDDCFKNREDLPDDEDEADDGDAPGKDAKAERHAI